MTSLEPNLPERLFRRGRLPDPDFQATEQLFHRCKQADIIDNRLIPAAISFRNWSVNRSKYSEPRDVLLPSWLEWGIAVFTVADVPAPFMAEGTGIAWSFRMEHVPEEENYSHSEIRSYKDGVYQPKPGPNELTKKWFRQKLSDRIAILLVPRV